MKLAQSALTPRSLTRLNTSAYELAALARAVAGGLEDLDERANDAAWLSGLLARLLEELADDLADLDDARRRKRVADRELRAAVKYRAKGGAV